MLQFYNKKQEKDKSEKKCQKKKGEYEKNKFERQRLKQLWKTLKVEKEKNIQQRKFSMNNGL